MTNTPNSEVSVESLKVHLQLNQVQGMWLDTQLETIMQQDRERAVVEFNKNLTHIIVRRYDELHPIQFKEWIEGMRKHHPDLMAEQKATLKESKES